MGRNSETATGSATLRKDVRADPGGGNAARDKVSWAVLAVVLLLETSYVLNSMDRQLFPIILPEVKAEFGFQLSEAGLLATIFTLGVGLGGIPAGYLIDRFSSKNLILVGVFLFSATTVLQGFATGFADMAIYRVLSGVGEGVQVAALFAALGAYFRQRRTLALGTLNLSFGLGGFLGPMVGAYLLSQTGMWQAPLWVFGGAGAVFLVAIYLVMPADFAKVDRRSSGTGPKDHFPVRNMAILLAVAVMGGFSLFSFAGLYPTYLRTEVGFDPGTAGLAAGMFGVGAMMGVPAGWLGDRFNQRKVILGALVAAGLIGSVAFHLQLGLAWQMLVAFIEGTLLSGFMFTNTQAMLQRVMPISRTGLASGLFVSAFFLPATVSGYTFGALKESLGWSTAGASILVVLPILSILAMVAIDPKHVRSDKVTVAGAHG
ncbi:MAG TPA: MFS transporter [Mycobacteriales bacterium]|jgi:Sugar phosphate permease